MRHFGVSAGILLAMAMLLCSCSEKHPVGPGGQPQIFFNWLPALSRTSRPRSRVTS